ncbi:hypothetical protein N7537_012115 [Penicillium hordei]|uniref:Uncharacterized protein n=1 Tax=Penicillium hordei TaxID=40994 RepID=A0AAD6DPG4_9EURO|nr:uncharacterized protein N7537_012115 [Penicillium hordei]KAJ5589437.1 hypothetical protein N7537_012115 [Penicillium hordei]
MAMRKIDECVGFNHDIYVPEGTGLIELEVTLGSNRQIKRIDINCLPYTGNEVGEFGGIFTDASPFQYQFNTPEVKGSVTFDRDHQSVCVLIDVTWNNKKRVDVHFPVVVFC